MGIVEQLDRWVGASLIDRITADRILRFEKESHKGEWRWPAILAVAFGALLIVVRLEGHVRRILRTGVRLSSSPESPRDLIGGI